MKIPALQFRSILCKTTFVALALGALFFATAPAAKANDWDNGHPRVAYRDWRYHEAIERREARERAAYYRQEWREHHRERDDYYRGWDRR